MRGVLNLNKPSGISSYDCIRRLKRVLLPLHPHPSLPLKGEGIEGRGSRQSKIPLGHAGTLDPMASGVLLILFGEATKLSRLLMAGEKEYEAEVLFGQETDTDDVTGRTTSEAAVPSLNPDELRGLLAGFVGVRDQVPPRFSALKQGGRPMYRLARKGERVELKPRPVTVHELELLDWTPPRARLRAVVSSGTYIRALARDLGRAAGAVATLSGLVRTRSGRFTLDRALALDQARPETIAERLVPMPDALPDLPRLELSEPQARGLLQGRVVEAEAAPDADHAFAATPDGKFLFLVAARGGKLRPLRVIYAD